MDSSEQGLKPSMGNASVKLIIQGFPDRHDGATRRDDGAPKGTCGESAPRSMTSCQRDHGAGRIQTRHSESASDELRCQPARSTTEFDNVV